MILIKRILYSTSCLLFTNHLYWSGVLANSFVCGKSIAKPAGIASKDFCSIQEVKKIMNDETYKYESDSSSVAFVTAPDDKVAKKLAKGLIEQKLAACVNIIPNIQSIYMWEGELNEDSEYLMMIKTRTSRFEELSKWIRDNHPYSVAEVISLPIKNGNPPYMKWLSESVPDKKLC